MGYDNLKEVEVPEEIAVKFSNEEDASWDMFPSKNLFTSSVNKPTMLISELLKNWNFDQSRLMKHANIWQIKSKIGKTQLITFLRD